jgi:hypothetical protein
MIEYARCDGEGDPVRPVNNSIKRIITCFQEQNEEEGTPWPAD